MSDFFHQVTATISAPCCRLVFPLVLLLLAACLPILPDSVVSPAGSYRVQTPIRFNLMRRDFLLHVPPGYRGDQPQPLLLVMHGAFSTATQSERETGFSALADRQVFSSPIPRGLAFSAFSSIGMPGIAAARRPLTKLTISPLSLP